MPASMKERLCHCHYAFVTMKVLSDASRLACRKLSRVIPFLRMNSTHESLQNFDRQNLTPNLIAMCFALTPAF